MKNPTVFVPDERVHFVDFIFGRQIRSPNIIILVHFAKHRGYPIAKNMSCCAKTVAINDAKRLGLRDNRKIAADVLRVSGIAGISRESGEIKAGAGGRPPSPDLRSSPPDLRPPRKLPKLPKLPKFPKSNFEMTGFLMQKSECQKSRKIEILKASN